MSDLDQGVRSVQIKDLFKVWRSKTELQEKNAAVFSFVRGELCIQDDQENINFSEIKSKVYSLTSKFKEKWTKCKRNITFFEEKYSGWLNEKICFARENTALKAANAKISRPVKKFNDLGHRAKKIKITPLLENFTQEEITFAAQTSLNLSGQRNAAHLVKQITENSPERAHKIKKTFKNPQSLPVKYTPQEALTLFVDGHFTKHSYKLIQTGAKQKNANIYPSYDSIQRAKQECYPPEESVTITDISAEIKLQALLDHTTLRLAEVQKEVLAQKEKHLNNDLRLIFKWGCDGSSGHSTYKQKFINLDNSTNKSDSSLFSVFLVPLQLQTNDCENNIIIWRNPKPSSTRFCRPIKFLFQKETNLLTKSEIENVEKQIQNLHPTTISISHQNVLVHHTLNMTMIDGKTFSVVSETSTQTCGICGATPKIMNNLDEIFKKPCHVERYKYGLSTLHAYIRCFECLLHIAYKLEIKKWQSRDSTEKDTVKLKKEVIRENLRKDVGILVDIPKPGYGTTNDGNTASKFFECADVVSKITGLDYELVERFNIILKALSCGYAIDFEAFSSYTKATAKKYVELYPWYPMPSSVHRLLIHGADIVRSIELPIGIFSEEAMEARNKDLRRYREYNTRKFSREENLRDLLNILLCSSDPVISSFSYENNRARIYNSSALPKDVIGLLSKN